MRAQAKGKRVRHSLEERLQEGVEWICWLYSQASGRIRGLPWDGGSLRLLPQDCQEGCSRCGYVWCDVPGWLPLYDDWKPWAPWKVFVPSKGIAEGAELCHLWRSQDKDLRESSQWTNENEPDSSQHISDERCYKEEKLKMSNSFNTAAFTSS